MQTHTRLEACTDPTNSDEVVTVKLYKFRVVIRKLLNYTARTIPGKGDSLPREAQNECYEQVLGVSYSLWFLGAFQLEFSGLRCYSVS